MESELGLIVAFAFGLAAVAIYAVVMMTRKPKEMSREDYLKEFSHFFGGVPAEVGTIEREEQQKGIKVILRNSFLYVDLVPVHSIGVDTTSEGSNNYWRAVEAAEYFGFEID